MKYMKKSFDGMEPYFSKLITDGIILNANESPILPPDKVVKEIKEKIGNIEFNRYPDMAEEKLNIAIAKKFDTSVAAIREMNEMGSSSNIVVGQKLKIPGTVAAPSAPKVEEVVHVVKKGEGLWDISRQYGVTIEDIVKWNGLKDTKIKIGEKLKIKTTKKSKK